VEVCAVLKDQLLKGYRGMLDVVEEAFRATKLKAESPDAWDKGLFFTLLIEKYEAEVLREAIRRLEGEPPIELGELLMAAGIPWKDFTSRSDDPAGRRELIGRVEL